MRGKLDAVPFALLLQSSSDRASPMMQSEYARTYVNVSLEYKPLLRVTSGSR